MTVEQLIIDKLDLWTSATTHKATSGRGRNGKLELTGLKKLRGLILELAVRGKLVPQDPNDEPAAVLLEKIAAEKARLVKEGKIKKPKALPEIAEDEKPFELPEGWEWVRLGNITQINPRNSVDDDLEASFIPMPLITTSYRGKHGQEILQWAEIKKGFTHFADGDIALAKITPCFENSKAAVFNNLRNGIGAGTTELHVARPYGNTINQFFILLCLKSPRFLYEGEQKMTGSAGQKRVPKDYFAGEPLPLPPLAEQRRIVEKVDELMGLCDRIETRTLDHLAAHETLVDTLLDTLTQADSAAELTDNWHRLAAHFDTLFTTEQSIDRLKQTILQLAVMGCLVPQDPTDEPASLLLEKIAAEKARLVKEGKIKKPKVLDAIGEDEKPFELPESWEWAYIWDVVDLITSGSRDWAKYYSKSGAIFVTMGNLSRGHYQLRMDNIRYVSPPKDSEGSRTRLEEDDLVVSITGDVGNLGLIPKGFGEAYINQHSCLVRFNRTCRNRYFSEYMRSPLAKWQFDAPQRGVKNSFRLGDLGEMLIPLPPLAEQHRIVRKVDALMALCDQLKARLAQADDTRRHLATALVDQAIQ